MLVGGNRTRRRPRKARQLILAFGSTWGGARKGAGRKRRGERACTPHRARPVHDAAVPVHVTLRTKLGPLRSQLLFPTVRIAMGRATRRNPNLFRIVEFSIQADHVHLIVEAADKRALSSGVRSVTIRIARYVNDLLRRKGPVFADRWHGRALKSPREVRRALVYVLGNFRKHARRAMAPGVDPYSSAPWFDGFHPSKEGLRFAVRAPPLAGECLRLPVAPARTWLLHVGWKRHGLIGANEAPSPAPVKSSSSCPRRRR
jgi:putative transposase